MAEDAGKPEGDPKEPEEKKQDDKVKAQAKEEPLQGPCTEEEHKLKLLKLQHMKKRKMLCSCEVNPLDFLGLRPRKNSKL